MENVFRPLRDEARRSRAQMNADQRAADKQAAQASLAIFRDQYKENSRLNREMFKAQVQTSRDAAKQVSADQRAAAKQMASEARQRIRDEAREKKTAMVDQARLEKQNNRQRLSDFEATVREMNRADARAQRDRVRQAMGLKQGGSGGGGGLVGYLGARGIVSGAGRDFSRIMRGAGRFAGQFAMGMGVDFDIASMVRRNTERDKMAQDIVNSAYQPGARGAAGVRQDAGALTAEARGIGNANRIDPTKVLEGAQKFVEVSGDLQTARDIMGQLATLSQATGSELNHVAEAAGNVAAQFADSPTKAQDVLQVMRAVAGQGKLGAVELRDMAKQMAALAAQASSFGGDKVRTIAMMGALAQEARQHGGAKSAPEAAFSVSSFVSTLSKRARLAELEGHGVKVFGKDRRMLDPQQIITNAIVASKGDPRILFGKMFMDERAKKVVRGFSNIFNETPGKTQDKVAAVSAEFERLMKSAMGLGEIQDSARLAMETDAAKAQAFQNKLDDVTRQLQARLLPTLERLAPEIVKVVEGFGKLVEWAAGSPWAAASAALALSVAKAGVGEIIARALGISMAGGAGGIGAVGGTLGLATLASTVLTATAALATWSVALYQLSKLIDELNPRVVDAKGRVLTDAEVKRREKMSPMEKAAEIAAEMNVRTLEAGGHVTGKGEQFGPPTAEVAELIDAKSATQMNAFRTALLAGTLKVHVVNARDIAAGSGNNPTGADGFIGPPAPKLEGVTRTFGPGGARQF